MYPHTYTHKHHMSIFHLVTSPLEWCCSPALAATEAFFTSCLSSSDGSMWPGNKKLNFWAFMPDYSNNCKCTD